MKTATLVNKLQSLESYVAQQVAAVNRRIQQQVEDCDATEYVLAIEQEITNLFPFTSNDEVVDVESTGVEEN